jgi:hypothetical protein
MPLSLRKSLPNCLLAPLDMGWMKMTNDPAPRLFADADEIRSIGEAMLACTLPKEAWTHEAHLSTCLWLLIERPDIDLDRALGDLIRRYNLSVGGVNDSQNGYHETITRAFLMGTRRFLERSAGLDLLTAVNGLLAALEGKRDWPLRFYSRDRLFTPDARLAFVEPDLMPFDQA